MNTVSEVLHANIALNLIVPYRDRNYTFVESKVQFWIKELENPSAWRGYVTARPLPNGIYELLTGHHRFEAIRRLGWLTMALEIVGYSDLEAHRIYTKDNNLEFAPTAGMAIGIAPSSVQLYRDAGYIESQARDMVRQELGLTKDDDVASLLEMHAALQCETLTTKIRDVLDIPAAISFWRSCVKWGIAFAPMSLQQQEAILESADKKDLRRDIPRVFSKLRDKIQTPSSPVTKMASPVKSIESRLIGLSNTIAKLVNDLTNTPEATVADETVETLRNNWNTLNLLLVDSEDDNEN